MSGSNLSLNRGWAEAATLLASTTGEEGDMATCTRGGDSTRTWQPYQYITLHITLHYALHPHQTGQAGGGTHSIGHGERVQPGVGRGHIADNSIENCLRSAQIVHNKQL